MPTPERARWAVEQLHVESGDHVLEVGCGHGHAAALVCELVGDDGSLTAIDRSPLMTDMAKAQLRPWLDNGAVVLTCGLVEECGLQDDFYDLIFGFSVAPMWRSPTVTAALWRALKPGGTVHLFDQPPGWQHAADVDAYAGPILAALQGYGFEVASPVAEQLSKGWAVHLRATRPMTTDTRASA